MLKLDPKNTDLLSQKQVVLKNTIAETSNKLNQLKDIQKQYIETGKDLNTLEYRNLQREIINTENKLKDAKNEMFNFGSITAQVIAAAGSKIQDFGNKIENIGQKISVISAAATGLIFAGTKYNADIEKYQTAFKTFLGSAEDAEKVIERIKKESEISPFKTEDLIQANQMLITTGENADESIKTISALADAIALTGGSNDALTRMASNLQQIKNAGKATSMDIRQFAYAGIDVYGILADYTGKTTQEIKNMEITYEDLSKALQMAASEGGKYFGGQTEMSNTLNGQIEKLKKSFQDLLGELTKSLYPLIKKITEKLQGLVEWFRNLDDGNKELIAEILLLVAVLGPALIIIGKVTSAIGTILTFAPKIISVIKAIKVIISVASTTIAGIGLVLAGAATAVTNFISMLKNGFSWIKEALMIVGIALAAIGAIILGVPALIAGIVAAVIAVVATLIVLIKEHWEELKILFTQTIPEALKSVWDAIVSFFTETIPEAFSNFVSTVQEFINSIITWFQELPYNLGVFVGEMIGHIIQFGIDAWNWVTTEVPKIIEGVINFVKELPGKVWTWLSNTFEKIKTFGINVYNKAKEIGSNFIDNIISFIRELPGKVWEWFQNTINKASQFAIDIGNKATEAAKNICDNIINGITGLPGQVADIGRNIVGGLWNGISGAGQWIKDKVGSFARGILDGMKEALGIQSPSKLFRDEVGKYIALGVGEGFLNNIGSVTKAMQSRLNLETGKISSNLSVAGSIGTSNVGGTKNTTISVNFYPQKMTEAELDNAFRYINKKWGIAW